MAQISIILTVLLGITGFTSAYPTYLVDPVVAVKASQKAVVNPYFKSDNAFDFLDLKSIQTSDLNLLHPENKERFVNAQNEFDVDQELSEIEDTPLEIFAVELDPQEIITPYEEQQELQATFEEQQELLRQLEEQQELQTKFEEQQELLRQLEEQRELQTTFEEQQQEPQAQFEEQKEVQTQVNEGLAIHQKEEEPEQKVLHRVRRQFLAGDLATNTHNKNGNSRPLFKPHGFLNANGSGNLNNHNVNVGAGLGTVVWRSPSDRHSFGVGATVDHSWTKPNFQNSNSKPNWGVGVGYKFSF